jgi:hypothetical protein
MTKEEVIKLAREAGFESNSLGVTYTSGCLPDLLERFAALVAAAEREEGVKAVLAQGEPTYCTGQHTKCAVCLEDKHTPLRIDSMGGYVCLTCIDRKLTGLLQVERPA